MNCDLVNHYLCDVVYGDTAYTTTKCAKILCDLVADKSDYFFDFRSKKYLHIDITKADEINAFSGYLGFNPHLHAPSGSRYDITVQKARKWCLSYLLIDGDIFSGKLSTNEFAPYSICSTILKNSETIDADAFNVAFTDSGVVNHIINNEFHIMQKIAAIPVLKSIGMKFEDVLELDADTLSQKIKEFWSLELDKVRAALISKNDSKVLELHKTGVIDNIIIAKELEKENFLYRNTNFLDELKRLYFVGDIYRYFPFNATQIEYDQFISSIPMLSQLDLRPINRWHHKLLVICNFLSPRNCITYNQIESGSPVVKSMVLQKKIQSIQDTKEELLRILGDEVCTFKSENDDTLASAIGDIEEMMNRVSAITADVSTDSTISGIINYWPPILGMLPKSFC